MDVNIPSVPKLAKGGIYQNGSWRNSAQYANGGLPNIGQMFVARQAGPELVGTIGGHTAVMITIRLWLRYLMVYLMHLIRC